ncbi:pentapeptide repeat-containing protein [Arthrobacter sp. JSM 101049]|uniref:pentapeptide repeat-containing protein n=1 Tax=Arthrobacter sp. JSM 101049 TaxID=929097 RepID=UPI003567F0CC
MTTHTPSCGSDCNHKESSPTSPATEPEAAKGEGRTDLRRLLWKDLIAPLIAALLVGILSLQIQAGLDDRRSDQDDRRENVRFVRDRSSEQVLDRPFRSIDLKGQLMPGLKLNKADFQGANLSGANLEKTDLSDADFLDADLTGAKFFLAQLDSADFRDADLVGADFRFADLTDADLRSTDLSGADLWAVTLFGAHLSSTKGLPADIDSRSCYDENTSWPDGYIPKSPERPLTLLRGHWVCAPG